MASPARLVMKLLRDVPADLADRLGLPPDKRAAGAVVPLPPGDARSAVTSGVAAYADTTGPGTVPTPPPPRDPTPVVVADPATSTALGQLVAAVDNVKATLQTLPEAPMPVGLATTAQLDPLAKADDLVALARRADLVDVARRDDLVDVVRRDDVAVLARRADVTGLAKPDDLRVTVAPPDLSRVATATSLNTLVASVTGALDPGPVVVPAPDAAPATTTPASPAPPAVPAGLTLATNAQAFAGGWTPGWQAGWVAGRAAGWSAGWAAAWAAGWNSAVAAVRTRVAAALGR